jgi:Uma2 family endonuclease
MTVAIPIHQMQLDPGSVVHISGISWPQFEEILAALGEKRCSRIAYSQGKLEIMVPLPEHERAKIVIADLVKAILRWQCRKWEPLGSTTFKRAADAGIEPDECFYIQNCQAVIGKDRIDLTLDPPPDLAIESDVTSKTRTEAYIAIQVPEVWIYSAGKLTINLLQGDHYVVSNISLVFPELRITEIIPQTVERAKQMGTSQALLDFEDWLNQRSG